MALTLQATVLLGYVRNSPAARLGALLMLCTAATALIDYSNATGFSILSLSAALPSSLVIPLFWLFSQAWFNDTFEFRWPQILIAGGYTAISLAEQIYQTLPGQFVVLDWLVDGIGTVLAVHVLWLVWSGRNDDLVESRRRIRSLFVLIAGLLVLWVLWSQALEQMAGPFPALGVLNDAVLCATAFVLTVILFGLRDEETFPRSAIAASQPMAVSNTPAATTETAVDPILEHRLTTIMREDRLYRDPELTIARLATTLDVPQHRLRQLINGGLGYRNFNAYLNQHRVEEVCIALSDPDQREVPILTIALDAGFGSLPAFNRAFKAAREETPSEFRRKAKNEN